MKVLIAVTHLLGAGHLSRALTLGRAFATAGHQVVVLSGGRPARHLPSDGVTLEQLPPLASDGTNFTTLLDDTNAPATEALFAARITRSVEVLDDLHPDVLITELFPFGRRVLSEEFMALLNAAQSLPTPPLILSSIRDILAPPSKPAKVTRADEIIAAQYDGVLVHSDAKVVDLAASWPVGAMLESHLQYTGFVAPKPHHTDPYGEGLGEVLVSAGGGSVGTAMFTVAVEAARLSGQRWRILVGGQDASQRISQLSQDGLPDTLTLEPVRPDFRALLNRAAASVSMCGYNTAMDLLQSGTPAVLVPFDDGGEVEQTLRARALAHLPGVSVLPAAELTAADLARAVDQACQQPRRAPSGIGFDGATRTVEIVTGMLDRRGHAD